MTITEKIDGTNAQIFIPPDGSRIFAGSRTRWITPANDNYGFAAWVEAHFNELLTLGPGRHFGEWWGAGINRGYGMITRRFSLFNVRRWVLNGSEPGENPTGDPRITEKQDVLPACCGLVPVMYRGEFDTSMVAWALNSLRYSGSYAAPGFMDPEGVVVYHVAGNVGFKKTLKHDDAPKSRNAARLRLVAETGSTNA